MPGRDIDDMLQDPSVQTFLAHQHVGARMAALARHYADAAAGRTALVAARYLALEHVSGIGTECVDMVVARHLVLEHVKNFENGSAAPRNPFFGEAVRTRIAEVVAAAHQYNPRTRQDALESAAFAASYVRRKDRPDVFQRALDEIRGMPESRTLGGIPGGRTLCVQSGTQRVPFSTLLEEPDTIFTRLHESVLEVPYPIVNKLMMGSRGMDIPGRKELGIRYISEISGSFRAQSMLLAKWFPDETDVIAQRLLIVNRVVEGDPYAGGALQRPLTSVVGARKLINYMLNQVVCWWVFCDESRAKDALSWLLEDNCPIHPREFSESTVAGIFALIYGRVMLLHRYLSYERFGRAVRHLCRNDIESIDFRFPADSEDSEVALQPQPRSSPCQVLPGEEV